ncbi:hypothetical protein ACFQ1L_14620 [Phytohabitans flavus]|nr:hypothetical protein [Phytohabitans flavus]
MTAAFGNEYEELHRLVDQLPVERVRALRAVVIHLLEGAPRVSPDSDDDRPRRLSFVGIMDAEPDLAARSEEILREELRRRAA